MVGIGFAGTIGRPKKTVRFHGTPVQGTLFYGSVILHENLG